LKRFGFWFQGFIQIGIGIAIAIGIDDVLFACEAAVSEFPPRQRAEMPAFPTPQVASRKSRVNGRDERLLVRAAFHAAIL
jgi:hypothetical protein